MIISLSVLVVVTTIVFGGRLRRRLADRILVHLAGVDKPVYALDLVSCGIGYRSIIYVTLASLERDGYLSSRYESNPPVVGLPRRVYQITERGRRAARVIAVGRIS